MWPDDVVSALPVRSADRNGWQADAPPRQSSAPMGSGHAPSATFVRTGGRMSPGRSEPRTRRTDVMTMSGTSERAKTGSGERQVRGRAMDDGTRQVGQGSGAAAASPWMTAEEAAQRGRCGVKTIYREVRAKRLKDARVGGRRELRLLAEWPARIVNQFQRRRVNRAEEQRLVEALDFASKQTGRPTSWRKNAGGGTRPSRRPTMAGRAIRVASHRTTSPLV